MNSGVLPEREICMNSMVCRNKTSVIKQNKQGNIRSRSAPGLDFSVVDMVEDKRSKRVAQEKSAKG